MGTTGCVSFMFDRVGQIIIEKKEGMDEDEVMSAALDAGASDFSAEDEYFEILTEVNDFTSVREALEKQGYEFASAELTMLPQNYVKLTDPDAISNMEKLIERLEDHDDVQNIYHNWEQDD